jgi:hypothetical protein
MSRQFFVFDSESFWRGFSNGLCLFVTRKQNFAPVCNDLKLKPLRPIVNNSTESLSHAWAQTGKVLSSSIDQYASDHGLPIKRIFKYWVG